jgi:hypothetical protein
MRMRSSKGFAFFACLAVLLLGAAAVLLPGNTLGDDHGQTGTCAPGNCDTGCYVRNWPPPPICTPANTGCIRNTTACPNCDCEDRGLGGASYCECGP